MNTKRLKIWSILLCMIFSVTCVTISYAAEIVLHEIIEISPMDDSRPTTGIGELPPEPNQFRATLSGHTLQVVANTGMPARVEITDQTTGQKIISSAFKGSTTKVIPNTGNYSVEIKSAGTTVGGYFEVQ